MVFQLSISPAMPIMSGIFFGFGYLLIFMAVINCLTDAQNNSPPLQPLPLPPHDLSSPSFPLATTSMYNTLGINWASSLLGFAPLAMVIIPFVFVRYGVWIHGWSKFAQRAAQGDVPILKQ